MGELVGLIAGLLAVGVFFEDYARDRASRAAEEASRQGSLRVAVMRRRLLDGPAPADSGFDSIFTRPASVRWAPVGSYSLLVVNILLFLIVCVQLRNRNFSFNPLRWDGFFLVSLVLVVCHCAMALLVWRSERDMDFELNRRACEFGDQVVSDLRTAFLGVRYLDVNSAPQLKDGLARRSSAPVDRLFDDPAARALTQLALKVVPQLLRLGWLSASGRAEARTVWVLAELRDTIYEIDRNGGSARWSEKRDLALGGNDGLRFLEQGKREPSHVTLRHLATAALAERLSRIAMANKRGFGLPVDKDDLDSLTVAARNSLNLAAEGAESEDLVPPIWVFPDWDTTWRSVAENGYENMSGVGRLLVRASASCELGDRGKWQRRTARLVCELNEGYDLIASLAAQLSAKDLRRQNLIEQLVNNSQGVDDGRANGRYRVSLAVVLAMCREGQTRSAIRVVDSHMGPCEPFVLSVAEALMLCTYRFRMPWKVTKRILYRAMETQSVDSRDACSEACLRYIELLVSDARDRLVFQGENTGHAGGWYRRDSYRQYQRNRYREYHLPFCYSMAAGTAVLTIDDPGKPRVHLDEALLRRAIQVTSSMRQFNVVTDELKGLLPKDSRDAGEDRATMSAASEDTDRSRLERSEPS